MPIFLIWTKGDFNHLAVIHVIHKFMQFEEKQTYRELSKLALLAFFSGAQLLSRLLFLTANFSQYSHLIMASHLPPKFGREEGFLYLLYNNDI